MGFGGRDLRIGFLDIRCVSGGGPDQFVKKNRGGRKLVRESKMELIRKRREELAVGAQIQIGRREWSIEGAELTAAEVRGGA